MAKKKRPPRDPERRQFRRDFSVALWVAFILALVVGVPFAITSLFSDDTPPPVATPTETVASCTGEKPSTPLRDAGPFGSPSDVDASHIFVATIKTYCGNMVFKIDAKDSPDAVRSFIFLARKRFYNGLTFDRILPNLGILGGDADPGYTLAEKGAGGTSRGDLVMVEKDGRIAARFALLTSQTTSIAGVKIGTVLDADAASLAVLARLAAQPAAGTIPSDPLYILHIEIQEFERG